MSIEVPAGWTVKQLGDSPVYRLAAPRQEVAGVLVEPTATLTQEPMAPPTRAQLEQRCLANSGGRVVDQQERPDGSYFLVCASELAGTAVQQVDLYLPQGAARAVHCAGGGAGTVVEPIRAVCETLAGAP